MKQKHFKFLLWKRLFVMPFLLMAMSLSAQHFFEYGMSIDSAVVITATANSYKIEFTLEMDSFIMRTRAISVRWSFQNRICTHIWIV